MLPRKKRRAIIIVSIILVIIIIVVALALLYLNTDMFKSNDTLFAKYIGQNVENIEALYKEIGKSEYQDLLQQSKYTTETQVKVNYAENIGTSSESTQNSINLLKLKINGQTDHSNNYNYQDIRLLNNEREVSKVVYIQKDNLYGIQFSDLFEQYILVENGKMREVLKKAGYTEEELAEIPNQIEFDFHEFIDILNFSEEEKQSLKTKYLDVINHNISKENFSKQTNQVVQIDGKNINTNAYILTVTIEQLNNIYIQMLEEVKQDEIILAKIDKLQSLLEKYQNEEIAEENNMRNQFQKNIEELIADITKNNIGKEEAKIIVYESNQVTVKTTIQNPNYEIDLEVLSYPSQDFVQVSYKNTTAGKEQDKDVIYRKSDEEANVYVKNNQNGKIQEYSILTSEKIENNSCDRNITVKCEDESNRVEANITQRINIVNQFEKQVVLDSQNSINLNELEEEEVKTVLDRINTEVSKKMDEIASTVIKTEDLWEVIEATGLVKRQQVLQAMGVTETERNRFNSKFEILQGEDLQSEEILNMMEAIKDNLIDMEVVSNTELKLKLDQSNKNEEIATTISSFIEENKNRASYNIKVEYDEITGLVSDLLLTMVIE